MKATVLIIDDEKNIRDGLRLAFEMEGFEVLTAASGKEGLSEVANGGVDLVITDLRMNGVTGEEVLRHITVEMPSIPVIVLTGHGSIDAAVDAMRAGAYDFLTKPLNLDHLIMVSKRALSRRELQRAHERVLAEVDATKGLAEMIGNSSALRRTEDIIKRVAPTRATVIITGESGVGKELVARAIHALSPRAKHEMVSVNCSALPAALLESELFGHEKGAFTGADRMQKGRFELAHESTLFLDEIGEIDERTQVKLLRVLESRTLERVGGEKTISIDVRVIAATNRNLYQMVKDGAFREDLYYRLFVVHIDVPPLRERRDDIPLLAANFLSQYAKENGKNVTGIESNARTLLYNYSWPGNIRELRNAIESAVVMSTGQNISADDLPPSIQEAAASGKQQAVSDGQQATSGLTEDNGCEAERDSKNGESIDASKGDELGDAVSIPIGITLKEAQKRIIDATLSHCNGNKTLAAKTLDIGRKTLQRKVPPV